MPQIPEGTPLRTIISIVSNNDLGIAFICNQLIACSKKIDPDALKNGIIPLLQFDKMGIYGTSIMSVWNFCDKSPVNVVVLLRAACLNVAKIKIETIKEIVASGDPNQVIDFDEITEAVQKKLPAFNPTAF